MTDSDAFRCKQKITLTEKEKDSNQRPQRLSVNTFKKNNSTKCHEGAETPEQTETFPGEKVLTRKIKTHCESTEWEAGQVPMSVVASRGQASELCGTGESLAAAAAARLIAQNQEEVRTAGLSARTGRLSSLPRRERAESEVNSRLAHSG